MALSLVKLRRCTPADIDQRYAWESTPTVRDNVHFSVYESSHSKYRAAQLERLSGAGQDRVMLIIESRGGRPLGVIWLSDIDWENRSAQFGVIIGPEGRRGIGFGPAAIEALVDMAFGDLNLHTLYNHVYETNEGMGRLVENVEPDLRVAADVNIGGRYVGTSIYTLINGKRGLRW